MKRLRPLPLLAALLAGCPSAAPPTTQDQLVETLPDPANAPVAIADGRLNCLGQAQPAATAGALELTGYVRTLADPDGLQPVPAATVEAFLPDGTSLGSTGADVTKRGRVSLSVPVQASGFAGYAVVQQAGYLDWRLQSSRPKTTTDLDGWAFLTTQTEVNSRAATLGITPAAGTGLLVGAVHDCDGFGVANAVVVVGTGTQAVDYVEGFDVAATRSYTSSTGRFAVANLPPGAITVKAFGRLKAGGPLTLLSAAQATVTVGAMTAVDLAPRTDAP